VAFVGIALYGRGLLVDTHDGADALVQVLVGKGHRVTDHEVSTLRTWRWRWVVRWRLGRSGGIDDDRGIGPAERRMKGFRSPELAQTFLSNFGPIRQHSAIGQFLRHAGDFPRFKKKASAPASATPIPRLVANGCARPRVRRGTRPATAPSSFRQVDANGRDLHVERSSFLQ